jgi:hypothetical protein
MPGGAGHDGVGDASSGGKQQDFENTPRELLKNIAQMLGVSKMRGMYRVCKQWLRTLTFKDGRDLITDDYAHNKFPQLMKTNELQVFLQLPLGQRNIFLNNVLSAIYVYDERHDFVQANKEMAEDFPNVWLLLSPGAQKVPTPDQFRQLVTLLMLGKTIFAEEL